MRTCPVTLRNPTVSSSRSAATRDGKQGGNHMLKACVLPGKAFCLAAGFNLQVPGRSCHLPWPGTVAAQSRLGCA